MEERIVSMNGAKKRRNLMAIFGLLFFLLVSGCAHKIELPSSGASGRRMFFQNEPIRLASTGQDLTSLYLAQGPQEYPGEDEFGEFEEFDEFDDEFEAELISISDPLEPWNRTMFHFNDKLITWILKPVSTGYGAIVPQPMRKGVSNFFENLEFPIRFVNCLLQAKFKGAGTELARFAVNSTIGLAGLLDVAKKDMGINEREEDFGQTLGVYGLGPGIYIFWPILGPSSLTNTVGLVGDGFLDPLNYLSETKYTIGAKAYSRINDFSLGQGEDYEDLKRMVDPYIAWRDAYFQSQQKKIKE
jgi:phospholipid-binding lipoprotein MlaA